MQFERPSRPTPKPQFQRRRPPQRLPGAVYVDGARAVRPYRQVDAGATRYDREAIPGRAEIFPLFEEGAATATVVVDEPREPRIMPTGVFDSRGKMICRVVLPITQRLGFATGPRWDEPADDEVECLVPEDMIMVSDAGFGMRSVDASELDE